jgi:quinol monooxygenase YgiN
MKEKAMSCSRILTSGHDMSTFPGCKEYRVFRDSEQTEKLWIFEVWENAHVHKKSLEDPVIKSQIEQAMPLIASFAEHHTLLQV